MPDISPNESGYIMIAVLHQAPRYRLYWEQACRLRVQGTEALPQNKSSVAQTNPSSRRGEGILSRELFEAKPRLG